MDAIVEEPEPECEFDGPWKEAIEAQGNSGNCRSCVAFTIAASTNAACDYYFV